MEARKIPCPSCRAEIEVDAQGDLTGEDIGHFDLHAAPETPETPPDEQTPPNPNPSPAEPPKSSWADRLAEALED